MDLTPRLGQQSLFQDGCAETFGAPVPENGRRLKGSELQVNGERMPLVCPDFCPVLIEGVALLCVGPHDLLQQFTVKRIFPVDAANQFIHIRPAMAIDGNPDDFRLVAENQAEKLSELCQIRLFHRFFLLMESR